MLPRLGRDADCSSDKRIEVEGNVHRAFFISRKFSPLFASSLAGWPYFCINAVLRASKSSALANGAELGSPKDDHNLTRAILSAPCLAPTCTPIATPANLMGLSSSSVQLSLL